MTQDETPDEIERIARVLYVADGGHVHHWIAVWGPAKARFMRMARAVAEDQRLNGELAKHSEK